MKRIIPIFLMILSFLLTSCSDLNSVENGETVNSNYTEVTNSNQPKLTCYELIDAQMTADGFTYIQDGLWGRGYNNYFLINVVDKTFDITNADALNVLPREWYNVNYEYYLYYQYNHVDRDIYDIARINAGGVKEDSMVYSSGGVVGNNGMFRELPEWMDYYISTTEKYGCSIEGIDVETLTGEYKEKKSSATLSDVVSVFDRTSDDDILRYFNDVHVEGNIEDNPRYAEINSYEEYVELLNTRSMESSYFINFLYHDTTDMTLYLDNNYIAGTVLKEFTKDVVFQQTTWIGDYPNAETYGIYFVYIDNPNGNFEYMYTEPARASSNNALIYELQDFRSIQTPFESVYLRVNKGNEDENTIFEVNPYKMQSSLDWYMVFLEDIVYGLEYDEWFITNYLRPFNMEWQKNMGLSDFFDEKYGYIDRTVIYADNVNSDNAKFTDGNWEAIVNDMGYGDTYNYEADKENAAVYCEAIGFTEWTGKFSLEDGLPICQ